MPIRYMAIYLDIISILNHGVLQFPNWHMTGQLSSHIMSSGTAETNSAIR